MSTWDPDDFVPHPEWQQGWLDATDAFLRLLDDVDRGVRSEDELREELARLRLRALHGVHNPTLRSGER